MGLINYYKEVSPKLLQVVFYINLEIWGMKSIIGLLSDTIIELLRDIIERC